MAHYDIFRDQLAIRFPAYGHALWEPSPGDLYPVVGIGDVGYISEGRFHRLFNIFLPADHLSHENFGVPDNYKPFRPKVSKHIISGILRPDNFCSAGVTLESDGLDQFATRPRDPGEVSFSCRGKQGAVLSLPMQAQRENTVVRKDFGKWMIQNIGSWFAWTQHKGLDVDRIEDIILVTGTDRTRSWANVAFLGGQADARVSFGVEAVDSGINWQFSSERKTGAAWHWGPSGENLPEDQCIFIRGFRVARKRMRLWLGLKAAAGPNPDSKDDDCEPDPELVSIPAVPEHRDPLHVMLKYIAEEKPNCDMAIIHDDDLALLDVLDDGASLETLQPDVVLSCLRSFKPVIHEVVLGPDLSSGNNGANADIEIVRVASLSATFGRQFLRTSDSGSGRVITTRSFQSSLTTSEPPTTGAVSSRFILDAALAEYKENTGSDLLYNWLAKELRSCGSAEAVLYLIQHQAEALDEFVDGDKRLMKWIGSSVHILYSISSTIGSGVGMPLPPAKIDFAGIRVLLAVAKDVRASHDALVDLFERIQFFLKRLGVHTQISPAKDMVEILAKIIAELISILSTATREMQQSRSKLYPETLPGRIYTEGDLKRLDNLTQEEVRIAIAQVLEAINGSNDDAKKANEAVKQIASSMDELTWIQIEQDVRTWFSPPDPSVNYDIARAAYQEGTAAWFFEGSIFKEWELIGPFLWIHGKPGSGKSTLCSAIIKRVISLRDAGHATLAYFFFDFRDKGKKQDVRNFLSSLLIQLSAHLDPCREIISRIYSTHGKGTRQPSIDVLTNCLHMMLFAAAQQPIYVIIDALDECPDVTGLPTPRAEVLKLLKGLVDLRVPNLHICVTSRLEVDIKIVLEPLAYSAFSLHDENGQRKDISDYVSSVVNSDRNMRKWQDREKELVVEKLSKKADGKFRWVSCQLEALRHCLSESIQQALDKLPETLDETYARILSLIPKASQERAHRLLQCLMVAVRPLRVEELVEVLAFDTAQGAVSRYRPDWQLDDLEQAVLSTCSSLVTIIDDHGSHVIQFSHSSVKEFLISDLLTSSLGDLSLFRILPGAAHTILAQACLGSLLYYRMDDESVNNLPLTEYAGEHWVTHAQFEDVASRVKDGMVSLFDPDRPHFAAWVGIHNIDEPYQTYRKLPSKIPTPLYFSSLCGFSALVEHLAIKHPQHVNAIGGQFAFPLRAALVGKYVGVAEILLKHGANVDIRGMEEQTLLQEAITDVGVVQLLLNYGADVNCRQDDLRTPLHLAVYYGELEVARVLLEHMADVDSQDDEGKAPLHLLFGNRNSNEGNILDFLRLLLEHGADANRQDEDNNTPLHLAIDSSMYKSARILLAHGADAKVENNMGKTPLHLLFGNRHSNKDDILDLARLLLENGADANRWDKGNNTPLHLAVASSMYKSARILLEHGADARVENNMGKTPLHLLFGNHHSNKSEILDFARLLIKHGADVDRWDKGGNTPLHLAIDSSMYMSARVLLEHGADARVKNNICKTPLHLLFGNRHSNEDDILDLARLLLEHGADVNRWDMGNNTPLHLALDSSMYKSARILLEHGADARVGNYMGKTPLHLLFGNRYSNKEDILGLARLLLENGAEVNRQDTGNNTPLHLAIDSSMYEFARVLLKHGADARVENNMGKTPLHLLFGNRHSNKDDVLDLSLLLLEHGADVNSRDKDNNTPLHLAMDSSMYKSARVFLEHGADSRVKNNMGKTPLHLLFGNRYSDKDDILDLTRLLMEHGVDVDRRDEDNNTALHLAIDSSRYKSAGILLENGADARVKNNMGKTPLHILFKNRYSNKDDILDLSRLLLEHGADVNKRDEDKNTPLHLAIDSSMYKSAGILLEYGADARVENNTGKTPFHLLFEDYYSNEDDLRDIARLLLERGADVNARVKDTWTPLHWAAFKGKLEITRLLLAYGAYVDSKNDQGETPLHLVLRVNYIAEERVVGIAKLLLECGADVNAQDKDHATPLQLARHRGRLDTAKVLLDYGAEARPEND